MRCVLVTGAGGAASIGFTRSLRLSKERYRIIGVDSSRFKACLSEANETHIVPRPDEPGYIDALNSVIDKAGVDFLHAQPWAEVYAVSECRERIKAKTFLPSRQAIQDCTNKFFSYQLWRAAGLPVPYTNFVRHYNDLFEGFSFKEKRWLRAVEGAGGLGAICTDDTDFAAYWIDIHKGWKKYTVSKYLSPRSTTWMSLWNKGKLISAQGRERLSWMHGSKFLSGVSGITGECKTVNDPQIDSIATRAVFSIDSKPNGLWSVDMCYDEEGTPNLTEINIGKTFTTSYFFAKAGLNFPDLYVRLGLGEAVEPVGVNPLPPDLVWIRGVDSAPVLTSMQKITEMKD